jgi:hypothetical protein
MVCQPQKAQSHERRQRMTGTEGVEAEMARKTRGTRAEDDTHACLSQSIGECGRFGSASQHGLENKREKRAESQQRLRLYLMLRRSST